MIPCSLIRNHLTHKIQKSFVFRLLSLEKHFAGDYTIPRCEVVVLLNIESAKVL